VSNVRDRFLIDIPMTATADVFAPAKELP